MKGQYLMRVRAEALLQFIMVVTNAVGSRSMIRRQKKKTNCKTGNFRTCLIFVFTVIFGQSLKIKPANICISDCAHTSFKKGKIFRQFFLM